MIGSYRNREQQLVQALAKLFSKFPVSLDGGVDKAVALAKDQVSIRLAKIRRRELEKLFERQIKTWRERGCPEEISKLLETQKRNIIARASEIPIAENNLPFLLVVPAIYLSIYTLMSMIRMGRKIGRNFLDPGHLEDIVKTPLKPCALFDIEYGEMTLDRIPAEAEKLISSQNRHPFTLDQTICLAIQTNALSRHGLWAIGSRFAEYGVPYLYYCKSKREIRNNWGYPNESFRNSSPSYGDIWVGVPRNGKHF